MRSFVALELKDEEVRSRLIGLQGKLMETQADLKPVEPQNMHITLKFLGEVPEEAVAGIVEALKAIELPKFELRFKGIGAFPSLNRINVVWVGVADGSEKVMELQSEVERRLASYGPPERFHAHMTLFRVKGGRNVGELSRAIKGMADVEVGRVIFSEFQFKKSTLTPSGPVYEDIATFPLR